ncbi:hypothetical protein CYMTET_50020, partial [Cymbomonas tetramitiformis]
LVALELSQLVVLLHEVCTKKTCPQMKASDEWIFLCAAHRLPMECCAIDYITHTLEGTTAVLNSNRWFPARGVAPPPEARKVFQSIARRLHRIFAHVFYHHRSVFQEFEVNSHLCERFLHLVAQYDWIKENLLIIPREFFTRQGSEAEGQHMVDGLEGDLQPQSGKAVSAMMFPSHNEHASPELTLDDGDIILHPRRLFDDGGDDGNGGNGGNVVAHNTPDGS